VTQADQLLFSVRGDPTAIDEACRQKPESGSLLAQFLVTFTKKQPSSGLTPNPSGSMKDAHGSYLGQV